MELNLDNDIECRFPELVASFNKDSDELFDSLLSSSNINFARSRTCLLDDFQLDLETPAKTNSRPRPRSMNSLNLTTSNSKSRTSLQKDSLKRWSINEHKNNNSSSSKTPLKSRRHNTPRTIKKCPTTCNTSHGNQEYQSSESSPSLNSFNDENDDSLNSSRVTFLETPTQSPYVTSVQKHSSLKSALKETCNNRTAISNGGQESCLKDKGRELIDCGPISPLHNITFRNKSSQKKINHVDSDCNTVTEPILLASKFNLVSACSSSPIPNSFMSSPNQQYSLLKTPVGRCSQSFLKTPYSSRLKEVAGRNNKTPIMSGKQPDSSKSLTGVKKLQSSCFKTASLQLQENKTVSNKISVHEDVSVVEDDDDDLPCTQPLSEILLRGVVAFIEIRSDKEFRNEGVKAELLSLGASVEKNFTKKVTHCFFQEGRMSTYKRAINWKVPLVCVLWIEACKAELRQVPLKGFEPHGIEKFNDALALYRPRTRIRRPVTDSKVLAKLRKTAANADKAAAETHPHPCFPMPPTSSQTGELIDALHSVAGDLRKATNHFQKILTSPILQKRGSKENPTSPRILDKESSEEIFEDKKKKRNKKLIFASSSDENCNGGKTQNKPSDDNSSVNIVNDSGNEIRISYDSDDLLVYAKKQAAKMRCSAPAKLLTSRKCKRLFTSCQKVAENKIDKINNAVLNHVTNRPKVENPMKKSKNIDEKVEKSKGDAKIEKDVPQTKKRKLMVPSQVIADFAQDSSESISESCDVSCPYRTSPSKKHRTVKAKFAKPQPAAVVLSDWESDDSLTRAARRDSSALFVKKEKKVPAHRFVPTIVCTSLSKRDVETVASITATLGRFAIEPVVSERTTHVVTSSSRRTINLLKGIARGCWVLDVKWVYKSLEAGKWLHEERFEMTSFSPAVKQSRLERQAFGPEFSLELFSGVGPVYVCRSTLPPASDLTELVRVCGGAVVSNARAARIVVGSTRPFSPTFCKRQPFLVSERWVLDSVTRLTLLDPQDYAVNEPET